MNWSSARTSSGERARPGKAAAAAGAADRLRITEIFLSLQGEARDAGWPTVFVRLTGCPLRCQYCDTAYAFHGGQWWDMDAAEATLTEVTTRYPGTDAARTAEDRLRAIQFARIR